MTSHALRISASAMLLAASTSFAGGPAQDAGDRSGPSPEQALQFLRDGNARFLNNESDQPNTSHGRLAAIAGSQSPFAILLSCSDSRVPVEHVFDRGFGDLFVVRVAGNVADTDEIGTVEYGVGHLHAPLVVVMGHSACGAVKAVASGAEVHGSIPGLVDNIIPAVEWVKKSRPELTGDALVNAAIEANVWQSIDDLISKSDEVRQHLESGRVKIVGAVYDIETGRVRFMGEHPFQQKLISSAGSASHGSGAMGAHDQHDQPDPANVPDHGAASQAHGEPHAEPAHQSAGSHDSHGDDHATPAAKSKHAEGGHGSDEPHPH